MWKACLSEPVVAEILKEHFLVVSDPIAAQNKTSFGVRVWFYAADRKEVREYWWGTGNCLIGGVFTEEYHRKRVKEMVRVLTEARQVATGKLQAAEEVSGKVSMIDVEKSALTIDVGFGRNVRQEQFQLSPATSIVNGLNERKDVEPIEEGLKSSLFEEGIRVRVATLTDTTGNKKVLEVRVTGRVLFRRKPARDPVTTIPGK